MNRSLREAKSPFDRLRRGISDKLHIPVGMATILAALVVPKVLAEAMLVWFVLGLIQARRLDWNSE